MAAGTQTTGGVKEALVRTAKKTFGPPIVKWWQLKDLKTREDRHTGLELKNTAQFSPNPSDNVQQAMNLIMPLTDPSAIGRAELVQMLAGRIDEVMAGLHNTGIVHFARFTIVDGNLCMMSVYDGDFASYIRDFIYNIGSFFDELMDFMKDPPPQPVESHPDAFVDWVRDRDAFQLGESVTSLADNLEALPRELILRLDPKRNKKSIDPDRRNDVQIFLYRGYPSVSVAQVRAALNVSW